MKRDLIVIGSGPAGMAAARVAAAQGASVLVVDDQRGAGGQIYRALDRTPPGTRPELGTSYHEGRALIDGFHAVGAEYRTDASVWHVSATGEVGFSAAGTAERVSAGHIILAAGAMERPCPVPGWTLPGVMTAGAAQVLLKESGLGVADAVFAGSGPLLALVVHQYLQAGIAVRAVLDTTPRRNYGAALRHLPGALRGAATLLDGLGWRRAIARAGIPWLTGVRDLRIEGEDAVSGVAYLRAGAWHRIETAHVFLHQGVVPHVNAAAAAGCDIAWDDRQAAWTVQVDDWFRSSQPRLSVAGDGARIGGAKAAAQAGHIAALAALERLGRIDRAQRDAEAASPRRALVSEMRLRPFLDALFRPPPHLRIPTEDATLVCRCEEVRAGDIRDRIARGCRDPNQIKSLTRCGMGPCQARMCGHTLSELIAETLCRPVAEVGYLRLRPPIKPLALAELAALSAPAKEG